MSFNKYFYLLLLFNVIIVDGNNLTEWTKIRRHRRALIYQTSAVVKFVCGITFPMALEDPIPFRQLVVAYNIQAQYSLPLTANQLYPKWSGRQLENIKMKFIESSSYIRDQSRNFLYTIIETYMNNHGINGRKCLQKAICENAYFGVGDGFFAEILNTVLTPNKNNCAQDYLDAFEAGMSGVDCISFSGCRNGESFFENILISK